MQRVIEPELLDMLPAVDPAAARSRRDLARINRVMRQPAIMAWALARFPTPATLADLGGGDGLFALAVARRMRRHWPGVKVVICDRQDIVSDRTHDAFHQFGWSCESRTGDIFETLPQADIMVANLFLHHFDDAALAHLTAMAAENARTFIACEPRRNRFALLGARLVGLLGCNAVTRHDAVVSVRAGFAGLELAALWPKDRPDRRWRLEERAVFPFSHVFCAHAF